MQRMALLAAIAALLVLLSGCGGVDLGPMPDEKSYVVGNANNGAGVYMTYCSSCHGADAKGIQGQGKDLHQIDARLRDADYWVYRFLRQEHVPPAKKMKGMTPEKLQDASAYVISLQQ